MSDAQAFTVNVEDTNAAPVLANPGQFTIDVGESLQVQLAATDADLPAQGIGYFLTGKPPNGMTLDPVTGLLEWTPGDAHEDQSFEIAIAVYDDQDPAGVAEGQLYIDVLKKPGLPPAFDAFPLIVWLSDGQFFQEITASDPEGEPVTVTGNLSALPGWVTLHSTPGAGHAILEWNTTGVAPGIYELPLRASTTRQQTDTTMVIKIVARAAATDYHSWSETYPFGPIDWLDHLDANFDGISNLFAYAFGVDPVNGIGATQPDPRLRPLVDATDFGVTFSVPFDGRPDLLYIVESSFDLFTWTEQARKDRNGPWTGAATVELTPLQGSLQQARVTLPVGPSQSFAYVRLRLEHLGTRLAGYQAWIDPFGLDAGNADPNADPNTDEVINLMAYALGFQSPLITSPEEQARLPITALDGEQHSLLVTTMDGGRSDVRYLVEESAQGTNWNTIAIKDGLGPWTTTTSARLVSMTLNTSQFAIASSLSPPEVPMPLLRLRIEAITIPPTP
jgi:hypothetical protein